MEDYKKRTRSERSHAHAAICWHLACFEPSTCPTQPNSLSAAPLEPIPSSHALQNNVLFSAPTSSSRSGLTLPPTKMPPTNHRLPLLLLSLPFSLYCPAVWALQCYQSQQSLTAPLNGSATSCPAASLTCGYATDYTQQIITRSCQSTNCTYPNGTQSSGTLCQNSTGNLQQYCCCYGDSCNSAERTTMFASSIGVAFLALLLQKRRG